MSGAHYAIRLTTWRADAPALQAVRRAVFIDEQRVPENLEWDAADARCVHALAEDDDARAIGCARLLPDGHIGRVAVLAAWRGRGVGATLLLRLIDVARAHGHLRVMLNAQLHAMAFYARYGFVAEGAPFDEAGIAHQVMARVLR
ncbi:MAG TPA: GNAT family N-acetyltransferase [Casimicrobiaceae bacterium]|nr:GNAT family N-acetyltransferase [Casimicrobiaceae bacterium]